MTAIQVQRNQPGWAHTTEADAGPDVEQLFLTAMSSLAATVTVLAAASPSGSRTGMTATAVTSLSTEPPMLVACVNRSSRLADTLSRTGWFSVNLLAHDQADIAADFAGRGGLQGDQRFKDGEWDQHPTGAPVLKRVSASCVCHVANSLQQGTHLVVVGAVHDVLLPHEPLTPLMYHLRQFTTVNACPTTGEST